MTMTFVNSPKDVHPTCFATTIHNTKNIIATARRIMDKLILKPYRPRLVRGLKCKMSKC